MPGKKIIFTVALLAVLILPLSLVLVPADKAEALVCTADTIYVNGATGNDAWNGTQSSGGAPNGPKKTIQAGINFVCDDGTVHVAAGTYNENLTISQSMDIEGAGARNTTINGGGSGKVIQVTSDPDQVNVISGFTIENGYGGLSNLWNPANQKIMTAGFNLRGLRMLPQLFNAFLDGGGVYISTAHTVTLNDCAIRNCQSKFGGGIYNRGYLYMNRCTISGNSSQAQGGGIYNIGDAWLTNCTISGNNLTDANGQGAGIYNSPWSEMNLSYVTIVNNQATGASARGGGFNNWGQATFESTIVANNTAGDGVTNNGFTEPAQGGTIQSNGYNLDSENSCGFNQPTDQVNTDPLLGPLQDNGGPTFTHAITSTSPAYNRGTNTGAPATDQRGVTRPQATTCDIGAYELSVAPTTTATATGTATFSTPTGGITGLTAMAPQDCGAGPPPMYFPHGIFNFTIPNITPGSTVTITITFPSPVPTLFEYWKCQNGNWVNCTSLLGSNDGDNVLTLTITDGGLGDADGVANGTIVDPGGPCFSTSPTRGGVEGAATGESSSTTLRGPNLKVTYMKVSTGQAKINQPVTITANVVNRGGETGSTRVALKINGQVEQTQLISVGPGGSRPIKFTVTRAEPGTYTVIMGNQRASFLVTEDTASTSVDGSTVAGIILAVLFTAVLIVLLLSFRRRPSY